MKRNVKIIIGVITCTVGLGIIFSNYYLSLKHEVFDEMNKLYYEEFLEEYEMPNEVNDEIVDNSDHIDVEENSSNSNENQGEVTDTTVPTTIPVESYIGYLRIPKVNLNRGFYNIGSKINNVNKNIYVHPASTFPGNNNNLILAAHSGSSSISYFKNLYKLELNDDIYLDYNNNEYHYKITDIYNVSKTGTVGLRINQNVSTLTLITCTKDDKNSQTVYICELIEE